VDNYLLTLIVGIVTRLLARCLRNSGLFEAGARNSSFLQCIQIGSGAHPASNYQWVPGVKWPGQEVDHAPHLLPRLRNRTSLSFGRIHLTFVLSSMFDYSDIWGSSCTCYIKFLFACFFLPCYSFQLTKHLSPYSGCNQM
jgi:hypothetical protein